MKNIFLTLERRLLTYSAVFTVSFIVSSEARATLKTPSTKGLKEMTENVIFNVQSLPGLITIVAYIAGLALGVLGVLKLKEHTENPSQVPFKDGAVRLGAGGALLALPFLFNVLIDTLSEGDQGIGTNVTQMQKLSLKRTIG